MIEILSLGAGVQSTTVLLMSAKGELPKIDHAIFADTGWEPREVYKHLEWLKFEAGKAGIKIEVVKKGTSIKEDALRIQVRGDRSQGASFGSMPLFTLSPEGKRGMIRRSCTERYKIRPIERYIKRSILGLRKGQRAPIKVVRKWFGISTDEAKRARESKDTWAEYYYPLLEKRMSRNGCYEWLAKNNYPAPPKSACIGCPYRSDAAWHSLGQKEWDEAVEFDRQIRRPHGMKSECYLHASRVPLDQVKLKQPEKCLFDGLSCMICGT